MTSSLCHWCRCGEEHSAKKPEEADSTTEIADRKGCTEADCKMGLEKHEESKEPARPRAWQDLQILVLLTCWPLMTVRLTKRTT